MYLTLLIITNVITGLGCTVLGMILTIIALNLEFVRKTMNEQETIVSTHQPARITEKRKRKFGRTDIILAIVIAGFIVTGVNQISVGKDQNRLVSCVVNYSNKLADALDRRTEDNKKLADADSTRDNAVDDLLGKLLLKPPATQDQIRVALVDLRATNARKVAAKKALDEGREQKSYPQAPRDVCHK